MSIPQRRVRLFSIQHEGSVPHPKRDGGSDPLYITRVPNRPNTLVTTWMVNNYAKELFIDADGRAVITLVIELDPNGQVPKVSMMLQEIDVIDDLH